MAAGSSVQQLTDGLRHCAGVIPFQVLPLWGSPDGVGIAEGPCLQGCRRGGHGEEGEAGAEEQLGPGRSQQTLTVRESA